MERDLQIDITQPIRYYIFPFNLKRGEILFRVCTETKEQIRIFKKETNLNLIKDKFPTMHTYIVYYVAPGLFDVFIVDMIKSWLKYEWEMPFHNKIISVNKLSELCMEERRIDSN